jgi:hypothetical protein
MRESQPTDKHRWLAVRGLGRKCNNVPESWVVVEGRARIEAGRSLDGLTTDNCLISTVCCRYY